LEPVGIGERGGVFAPVGVGGSNRVLPKAGRDCRDGCRVVEVEHQQRLRVRIRWAVTAAGGELEMRAAPGHLQEHAVVSLVITEATDLDQPEAVAIEADELVQSACVTGDAQLHRMDVTDPRAVVAT
jgi:hypothetical protein